MKGTISLLGILMLTAVMLLACGGGTAKTNEAQGTEVQVEGGSYWLIAPAQLYSMLDNKDFLLVNTETSYLGEIPDTDLFIPYNEIEQNLGKFPQNKDDKIVIYCSFGAKSNVAAITLVKVGYTKVMDLQGGMMEWEGHGYAIIHKP